MRKTCIVAAVLVVSTLFTPFAEAGTTFTILGFKFCVSEEGDGDPCAEDADVAVSSRPMGLETVVPQKEGQEVELGEVLERLANAGVTAQVAMIDGTLVMPGKPLPKAWRDARLKTPAGTVTLLRRPGAVAVVVFGNADEGLRKMQEQVASSI